MAKSLHQNIIDRTIEKQKHKQKHFLLRCKKVHGNRYNYKNVVYTKANEKVSINCTKHGAFWQIANNHLQGHGCPKCATLQRKHLKSQSKLYKKLLKSIPIDWIMEYSPSWLGLQRFDIYNLKYNIAVEYNGEQHYMPIRKFGGKLGHKKTCKNDAQKRAKCIANDCNLFEVKYNYSTTDYNDLVQTIQTLILTKNGTSK